MNYQQDPNHQYRNSSSPVRPHYALHVDDIPGARAKQGYATKNTHHYQDRLVNNNEPFEIKRAVKENMYTYSNYHEGVDIGKTQKKHYGIHHDSEIQKLGMLKGPERMPTNNVNIVDFPRNLNTHDIPGAKPGSLQSQTVKNHDLAHKMREEGYIQNQNTASQQDALDRFREEQATRDSPNLYNANTSQVNNEMDNYPSYPVNLNYPKSQNSSPTKRTKEHDIPPAPQHYVQSTERPSYNERNQMDEYIPQNSYNHSPNLPNKAEPRSSANAYGGKGYTPQYEQDVLMQKKVMESRANEVIRGRAFDIISHNPTQNVVPAFASRAYGSSIKAMYKNQEYARDVVNNLRGYSPATLAREQPLKNDYYGQNPQGYGRDDFGGDYQNDYPQIQNDHHYADLHQSYVPSPQEQYHAAKALKNYSDVKLY